MAKHPVSKQYAEVHKGRDNTRVHHKEIRQPMKSNNKKNPTQGNIRTVVEFGISKYQILKLDNAKLVIFPKLE